MLKRFLLLLLLPPLCLPAQTSPASRIIDADLANSRGSTSRMYNFCVGAGRANEGLRADWQRQLRHARAECGFRYIRFHGLFCDDMGVYQEDKRGQSVYNWQYVDELFDFLLSIGMKPFVELGFMPGALASGPHTIFWYKANVTPPKDYAKWEAFIAAFVRHVTERYGRGGGAQLVFRGLERAEPRGLLDGHNRWQELAEFTPIARAEYYRALRIDGAPIEIGRWPPIAWADRPPRAVVGSTRRSPTAPEKHLPLDFVSTHSYATMSGYLDENGNAGTVFSPDRNAITGEVKGVRGPGSTAPRFAKAELHYTEWSSSYTPSDPIHDSYHNAAFILDKVRNIGPAANVDVVLDVHRHLRGRPARA